MDLLRKSALKERGSVMHEGSAAGPSAWAQRMLLKQGWTEGAGLGKHQQGVTSHIKVSKKDDPQGIGYKPDAGGGAGVAWGDQWWFRAYDASVKIGGKAAVGKAGADESDDDDDGGDSEGRAGKRGLASSSRPPAKRSRREEGAGGDAGAPPPASKRRPRGGSDSSSSDAGLAAAGGAPGGGGAAAAAARPGGGGAVGYDPASAPSFVELFRATGGARLGMRARRPQPGKWARAEAAVGAGAGPVAELVAAPVAVAAAPPAADVDDDERARAERKRARKEARRRARLAADASEYTSLSLRGT